MRTTVSFNRDALEKTEVTISMTLQLKHWRDVREQINRATGWPTCDLKMEITEAIYTANKMVSGAVVDSREAQADDPL